MRRRFLAFGVLGLAVAAAGGFLALRPGSARADHSTNPCFLYNETDQYSLGLPGNTDYAGLRVWTYNPNTQTIDENLSLKQNESYTENALANFTVDNTDTPELNSTARNRAFSTGAGVNGASGNGSTANTENWNHEHSIGGGLFAQDVCPAANLTGNGNVAGDGFAFFGYGASLYPGDGWMLDTTDEKTGNPHLFQLNVLSSGPSASGTWQEFLDGLPIGPAGTSFSLPTGGVHDMVIQWVPTTSPNPTRLTAAFNPNGTSSGGNIAAGTAMQFNTWIVNSGADYAGQAELDVYFTSRANGTVIDPTSGSPPIIASPSPGTQPPVVCGNDNGDTRVTASSYDDSVTANQLAGTPTSGAMGNGLSGLHCYWQRNPNPSNAVNPYTLSFTVNSSAAVGSQFCVEASVTPEDPSAPTPPPSVYTSQSYCYTVNSAAAAAATTTVSGSVNDANTGGVAGAKVSMVNNTGAYPVSDSSCLATNNGLSTGFPTMKFGNPNNYFYADIATTTDGNGWWTVRGNGSVTAYGSAIDYGSVTAASSNFTGITSTGADGYYVLRNTGAAPSTAVIYQIDSTHPGSSNTVFSPNLLPSGKTYVGIDVGPAGTFYAADTLGEVFNVRTGIQLFTSTVPGSSGWNGLAIANGTGGWLINSNGSIFTVGSPPSNGFVSDAAGTYTGIALTPGGKGLYYLHSNGTVDGSNNATSDVFVATTDANGNYIFPMAGAANFCLSVKAGAPAGTPVLNSAYVPASSATSTYYAGQIAGQASPSPDMPYDNGYYFLYASSGSLPPGPSPFLTTQHADIHAGGGIGFGIKCGIVNGASSVSGNVSGTSGPTNGPTVDYAISAAGVISGFSSNGGPFGSTNLPASLNFTNYGTVCRPDLVAFANAYENQNPGLVEPQVTNKYVYGAATEPDNFGTITDITPSNSTNPVQLFGADACAPSPAVSGYTRHTIYIHGDLIIKSNVCLNSAATTRDNYPSLGVIVQGNILINPGVTEVDGYYWASGQITTCNANLSTSGGVTSCKTPLLLKGLLMANRFNFTRTFGDAFGVFGPSQPAETYDFTPDIFIAAPPAFDDVLTPTAVLPDYPGEKPPLY